MGRFNTRSSGQSQFRRLRSSNIARLVDVVEGLVERLGQPDENDRGRVG
jgi:hypothetical protein